ncbi:phage tail protein, partial [Terrisporobacter sp.]|uniref:phage tail protein n=1 Tax=Terrisporobacter sp. TaxID=1965305 RepID=UPI00289B1A65
MIKTLYVLDRNKNIIGFISNNGSASTPFFNDKFTQILSTGAETFEFDVIADDKTNTLLIEGNYIMFEHNGRYKMFQIMTAEDDDSSYQIIKSCYCEIVGLELLNSYVRPCTVRGDIVTFFNVILQDSNWQLGKYSPSLVNISKDIDIAESKSIYTLIQENISTYNNIEIEFRTEFSNNKVTGYYIDVYEDGGRGKVTHKRFEHGTNVTGITRKGDITGFYSALIGEGKNGINFKDIIWSKENGDPCDKPAGQDFLLDDAAHKMFSLDGKYITGLYKTEDTNAYDLILSTYNKLQEVKNIKYSYEVEVGMKLEEFEQVEIGDTVYVIDNNFNPPLLLESRVSKLEISFSDYRSNKCILDNFKEVKGKIKNWSKNDVIKDTIDAITGFKGKLTQADIDRIREFLADLDIQSEEIEKLLKKYEDSLEDTVIDKTEIAEDSENYRAIKLSKIDGGLWLGDNRIYGIKKNKCANITNKVSENTSSSGANEYKNAVAYYAKFSLGTKANSSSMDKLISSSNKYKISTIVKYWAKKFGLDPYLVYAVIMAESSGNPYCKTKSSAGGYGIMQCERAAYFNKKQTIKFLDGSTKSFTPSYSTMDPSKGSKGSINGVTINKNINNQIMFGCHELRKSLERFKYNIFASLMGYNFGLYGADWVVCKYVANKNGYTFVDKFGYTVQSSKVQAAYFKELATLKAPWSNLRKTYVSVKRMGTATNIEYYLRWYRSVNGQLPYALDSKGKKKGYGANKTSIVTTSNNTTIKTGVATTLRNKIVAKAKEICKLHQTYKKATYDQDYRIVNDDKRFKAPKTIYGIKKPYCYDCSSLVSCAYKETGLTSVYAKSCQYGTLVEGATAKSGYKMFKLTKSSIEDAIAGDIIMFCNNKCPSSFTREQASKKNFTHHTAIYCGKVNGKHMLAHASKWAYHPEAIRYESFDAYNNRWKTKDYHLWNYCFILRPWDLVAKDRSSTETKTTTTTNAPKVETNEVNLKGLNGATPLDYYDDSTLIEDITINSITDDDNYPKTVSHCFLHFGINDLSDEGIENYKSLINALLKKYPKKPIFVAKEYHVNSQYGSNYKDINIQIDNFNNAMLDYSNRTRYVIFVNTQSSMIDSSTGCISTSLTNDGFSMKDKTSCDIYYTAYKKAILSLATPVVTSTSTSVN